MDGQPGKVTPGACVVLADAYGETQTLLCEFAYAGGARAHGVVAALDAILARPLTRPAWLPPPGLRLVPRRRGGSLPLTSGRSAMTRSS